MKPQSVSAPTEDDLDRLAKQVLFIYELAQRHWGSNGALNGTASDLPVLQRLLDDNVFQSNQTWELQSLGLAFGSVLSTSTGLDWVTVEDEYGRDPALAYPGTSLIVYPLTMVSKRVEAGEAVDLRHLHERVVSDVAALKGRAPESPVAPPRKSKWRLW